eukprot:CAMPEP_0194045964 /NCGR_PEP_ID=MMETSP0009_2-20130614/19080_1 /TAXON_ID=210454 /ORGANISM="Grammatophora oceanica, Strain CCMP 410" /LENGTH=415 /DNA_ID=CAMNT_0038691033 /DNA_START=102 /DNA_END=1349 /DNA_ORIENTATION=+
MHHSSIPWHGMGLHHQMEPVLIKDGYDQLFDVSNLCSTRTSPSRPPVKSSRYSRESTNNGYVQQQRRPSHPLAEMKLYPEQDDLSKVTIESTSSVFRRLSATTGSRRTSLPSTFSRPHHNGPPTSQLRQMPLPSRRERSMSYDVSTLGRSSQSRPGAFHHAGGAKEKKKERPALPSWVEEHTKPDVERKLEHQSSERASSRRSSGSNSRRRKSSSRSSSRRRSSGRHRSSSRASTPSSPRQVAPIQPAARHSHTYSDGDGSLASTVASMPVSPIDSSDDDGGVDYEEQHRPQHPRHHDNKRDHHHHHQQNHQQQQQQPRHEEPPHQEIEVSPGYFLPLRGSQETMQALEVGCAVSIVCFCCQVKLKTVPDADYVICPDCRVLSPIPDEVKYANFDNSWRERLGGVGLGLKVAYDN